jgi:hypothetical protein
VFTPADPAAGRAPCTGATRRTLHHRSARVTDPSRRRTPSSRSRWAGARLVHSHRRRDLLSVDSLGIGKDGSSRGRGRACASARSLGGRVAHAARRRSWRHRGPAPW